MEKTLANDQAEECGSDDAVAKERVSIQSAEKQEHEKHDSRNDQTREPITGSVRANNKWHQDTIKPSHAVAIKNVPTHRRSFSDRRLSVRIKQLRKKNGTETMMARKRQPVRMLISIIF